MDNIVKSGDVVYTFAAFHAQAFGIAADSKIFICYAYSIFLKVNYSL